MAPVTHAAIRKYQSHREDFGSAPGISWPEVLFPTEHEMAITTWELINSSRSVTGEVRPYLVFPGQVSGGCAAFPEPPYRESSQIQFTSHVFPPSGENDCSMRAELGERLSQT